MGESVEELKAIITELREAVKRIEKVSMDTLRATYADRLDEIYIIANNALLLSESRPKGEGK